MDSFLGLSQILADAYCRLAAHPSPVHPSVCPTRSRQPKWPTIGNYFFNMRDIRNKILCISSNMWKTVPDSIRRKKGFAGSIAKHSPKDFVIWHCWPNICRKTIIFVLFAEHSLTDSVIIHCLTSTRRKTFSFCSRPSVHRAFAEDILPWGLIWLSYI